MFVALSFAWSWGFGLVATQFAVDHPALSIAIRMVAGFGPSLAAVAMVAFTRGPNGLGMWFVCCLERRQSRRLYVIAFLMPLVLMVAAIWIDVALGGAIPPFLAVKKIPLAIANFGFVLLVGGPIGEEFGWRGYLTPALNARMNWRAASLIVGVIWGVWHLPLFFTTGTPQAGMAITVFLLNILAGAVVFGWIFDRSGGSVLPVLVLHTSLNAWAGTLAIIPTETIWRPYVLVTGLLMLVALALLLTPDCRPLPEPAP